MTSELISNLTNLIERWETLSEAAGKKVETSGEAVQGGFYAGVLFGMNVARDELATALATAMVEAAKPSPNLM